MNITRTFFINHKLELSEKKSKIMNHKAATGTITFSGLNTGPITLEMVLAFKYLGVPVCCSPHSLFRNYNDQVKKRAQTYLSSVLSLVKTGPDRADLAYTLWVCCALPAILYGSEIIPLTLATISEIERCQSQVGKFILQIPRSSASVASNIDAGLKPVWSVIAERVLSYACHTMKKSPVFWPKIAMDVNLASGSKSSYTRYLLKWKSATDTSLLDIKLIKKAVTRAAISDVIKQQQEHSTTTFAMSPPNLSTRAKWFQPKAWVSDSCRTKIISVFRACNSGLGNRGPTKDGRFFSLCPLCSSVGINALNNEVIPLSYCFA